MGCPIGLQDHVEPEGASQGQDRAWPLSEKPFRPVQAPLCSRAPGGENEHILSSCPKWKTPP